MSTCPIQRTQCASCIVPRLQHQGHLTLCMQRVVADTDVPLMGSTFLLQTVPESLAGCRGLRQLNLDRNRLRTIPPSFFSSCSLISTLRIEPNPFTPKVRAPFPIGATPVVCTTPVSHLQLVVLWVCKGFSNLELVTPLCPQRVGGCMKKTSSRWIPCRAATQAVNIQS
jgi:hypothetical protein